MFDSLPLPGSYLPRPSCVQDSCNYMRLYRLGPFRGQRQITLNVGPDIAVRPRFEKRSISVWRDILDAIAPISQGLTFYTSASPQQLVQKEEMG